MKITWTAATRSLPPQVRMQAARFLRLVVLTAVPQLLAAAADPKGLTLKIVAGIVTAAAEVAWRQVAPVQPSAAVNVPPPKGA